MRAKINQLSKIRVGIVNYLNTKPLLYGIEHSPVFNAIELFPDYPSNIASMLADNRIDIGFVPVAIIPDLHEAHIVTNYCIGSDGPVASVCLLSDVPIPEIKRVVLDYQSRTSALLVQILLEKYWHHDVLFVDSTDDFLDQLKGDTATLVIGDRCLRHRTKVKYVYDLGEAWKDFTGLPFVFAAWVSNKKLPDEFIIEFNKANQLGIASIEKVARENSVFYYDSLSYFTKNISYLFDANKRKGMELFLRYCKQLIV